MTHYCSTKMQFPGCWAMNYLSCCNPFPFTSLYSVAVELKCIFAGRTPPAKSAQVTCYLHTLKPQCAEFKWKNTTFSLTSQTNPNDCYNRDTNELMTNVALMVSEPLMCHHVSLWVLLSPCIRKPIREELVGTPGAAAPGINKCNQKHN